MKRYPYFAYGSNLDKAAMGRRCPDAIADVPADLPGWRLTFRGVADIEPMGGRVVRGALWMVSDDDVRALDIYEGAPHLYDQEMVLVLTEDGRTVEALTYVMCRQDDVGFPSPGYLATIMRGFRDFGLDASELERAVRELADEHKRAGVDHYVPRGPKRMMAVSSRDPDPEPIVPGMSPATRRLAELERDRRQERLMDAVETIA